MKAKDIFLAVDFFAAVALALTAWLILPYWISSEFAKDLYSIGISVLSIVFSVYFAALAIIMSSSDDDFIRFLEEEGQYTTIIISFEWSLGALFVALIYSMGIYAFTSYWLSTSVPNQEKWCLVVFSFLFFYGLFSAASSTRNAIIYSRFRTRFLNLRSEGDQSNKPSGASGS